MFTPQRAEDESGGHNDGSRDTPFPHLQHVLVQPMSRRCNPAYPWDGQRTLRDDLQACAARARPGLRFDVLPPCTPLLGGLATDRAGSGACGAAEKEGKGEQLVVVETAPQRCTRRAREEWLERVKGHAGCWSAEYAF